MARVPVHDLDTAPAASTDTLKHLHARMGTVLNIFGEMAHSPAVLNAYAAFEAALAEHGTLTDADTPHPSITPSREGPRHEPATVALASAAPGGCQ